MDVRKHGQGVQRVVPAAILVQKVVQTDRIGVGDRAKRIDDGAAAVDAGDPRILQVGIVGQKGEAGFPGPGVILAAVGFIARRVHNLLESVRGGARQPAPAALGHHQTEVPAALAGGGRQPQLACMVRLPRRLAHHE